MKEICLSATSKYIRRIEGEWTEKWNFFLRVFMIYSSHENFFVLSMSCLLLPDQAKYHQQLPTYMLRWRRANREQILNFVCSSEHKCPMNTNFMLYQKRLGSWVRNKRIKNCRSFQTLFLFYFYFANYFISSLWCWMMVESSIFNVVSGSDLPTKDHADFSCISTHLNPFSSHLDWKHEKSRETVINELFKNHETIKSDSAHFFHPNSKSLKMKG